MRIEDLGQPNILVPLETTLNLDYLKSNLVFKFILHDLHLAVVAYANIAQKTCIIKQ